MNFNEISIARLFAQRIITSNFNSPKDVVLHMGAMQAQGYAMAKWGVGIRLANCTDKQVEEAINKGEIIRTHVLRPTWHFVSPADIYWMLDLTAPHVKASTKSRWKELELDEATFKKSNAIIEKALKNGNHLTREDIMVELAKSIPIFDQWAAHFMFRAELDGLVCSGTTSEKKQTYALLEERVPKPQPLTREEALARLAEKYFNSHGPATLQDFTWWSGLSVTDAKKAMELISDNFIKEKIDQQVYWFPDPLSAFKKTDLEESASLLPAFDEFIISYKDRSASLPFSEQKKAVSNNGIFRPTIVINGQVVGIWKRTVKKDKVMIEADFFTTPTDLIKALADKEAVRFAEFLNLKAEVK